MADQSAPTPVPLMEQSFVHRGHRLVYDVYEPVARSTAARPTVVYMHGLLLDSEMNRGIAEALAAGGNRVVLLDLLGHGRSDKPTHASEYRMDSYAAQVVALLDHLGVERAVLGGLSLGANVSLLAATLHPDRVAGLILEMPVLEWAVPSAAMLFVPLVLVTHYLPLPMRLAAGFVRMLPRTPIGAVNSVMNAASTPPELMSAILHGVLVGPVAPTQDERRAITAPTLLLAHANDLIHPFDDAETLAARMHDARLVKASSPVELRLFPNRLTTEIVDFVGGLGPLRRRRPRRPAATAGTTAVSRGRWTT